MKKILMVLFALSLVSSGFAKTPMPTQIFDWLEQTRVETNLSDWYMTAGSSEKIEEGVFVTLKTQRDYNQQLADKNRNKSDKEIIRAKKRFRGRYDLLFPSLTNYSQVMYLKKLRLPSYSRGLVSVHNQDDSKVISVGAFDASGRVYSYTETAALHIPITLPAGASCPLFFDSTAIPITLDCTDRKMAPSRFSGLPSYILVGVVAPDRKTFASPEFSIR